MLRDGWPRAPACREIARRVGAMLAPHLTDAQFAGSLRAASLKPRPPSNRAGALHEDRLRAATHTKIQGPSNAEIRAALAGTSDEFDRGIAAMGWLDESPRAVARHITAKIAAFREAMRLDLDKEKIRKIKDWAEVQISGKKGYRSRLRPSGYSFVNDDDMLWDTFLKLEEYYIRNEPLPPELIAEIMRPYYEIPD